MGRAPCCDKANVKKGPWSPEEDAKLKDYIEKYGTGGNWIALPQKAGLRRCGKSCRLRWLNYLRPNIKHGEFSDEEDRNICTLVGTIGSRWSIIAAQLPGRTDNDIKNYWNTKLKKKLLNMISGSGSGRSSSSSSSSSLSKTPPFLSSSHHHHHRQNPNQTSFSTSQQLQQYSTNFFPIINVPPSINSNIPSNFLNLPASSTVSSSMFQMDCSSTAYPNDNNLLVFGNDHKASCSTTTSSEEKSFQSCISEVFQDEDHSKKLFMLNNYGNNGGDNSDQKPNWYVGQNPLDYNLEEIKQLIRSSNRSNNYNNSIGCIEENKTEDKFMYYY